MNGSVAKAKRNTPIEPGCQIIIPSKPEKMGTDWTKVLVPCHKLQFCRDNGVLQSQTYSRNSLTMQEEKDILDNANDEKEIDLLELATKLWEQRKKLIIWSICGAVIGLIVAFSIPKEYDTTVKLAPEISDPKAASGGLGALASMAGLGSAQAGADAVYPQLYPDVVRLCSLHHKPFRRGSRDEGGWS